MTKNISRVLVIVLLLSMALSLASCDNGASSTSPPASTTSPPPAAGEPVELTYYRSIYGGSSQVFPNLGDTPYAKKLMELTGVTLQYIHPPIGQEVENFGLMLASRNFPDIIEWNWSSYEGGAISAIEDGVIIPLNEAFEKYSPNLMKILADNPSVVKTMKTENGDFFGYPLLSLDPYLLTWQGLIVRQDFLDELGLAIPETIDEWTNMLTQFKDKLNIAAPLTLLGISNIRGTSSFIGAYGIAWTFFVDSDGKVKYGPADPRYKDFLSLMNSWYEAGLLDPDFAANDGAAVDAKVSSGKTGAIIANLGGGIGRYMGLMADDPVFNLAGAPPVVLEKGKRPVFGMRDEAVGGIPVSISTSNKHVEETARFLDFFYSHEGYMLNNFGIEGESYTMVDGYPTYTDIIKKNPDGLSMSDAMSLYMLSSSNGPFVLAKEYFEQYTALPQQRKALENWTAFDAIHALPPLNFTSDESQEIGTVMNEVDTYMTEKTLQFIMGQLSMNEFDNYLTTIKGLGIEGIEAIYDRALARFDS